MLPVCDIAHIQSSWPHVETNQGEVINLLDPAFGRNIDKLCARVRCKIVGADPIFEACRIISRRLLAARLNLVDKEAIPVTLHLHKSSFRIWLWHEVFELFRQYV